MNGKTETSQPNWYRLIWRWHFYAGLFVAPFLIILSVTGAIYLFNDELNDLIYPELRFAPAGHDALPPQRWVDGALAAFPGSTVSRIDAPTAPGRTVQLFLTPKRGEPVRVFVDPGTARVLGSYVYTHSLVGFADVMHGSLLLGEFGDYVVETAACWAIILVGTGIFLWWPRGARGLAGVLLPRLKSTSRVKWRDLHAITGVLSAALILFLLFTGLPWASFWGGLLKDGSNALGIGYPAAYRGYGVASDLTVKQAIGAAPWTLENAPMPRSEHDGHNGHEVSAMRDMPMDGLPPTIGINRIAEILTAHGMPTAWRLSMPEGPRGVFTAYTYPDRPQGQHTLHIDRYSGRVLVDVGYQDYGWVAKAVELGVALHMGNYFGRANQIVMLLPCLAIIGLVGMGLYLWWRRRPAGSLGAPPVIPGDRLPVAAMIAIALLAILFPLMGLSLACVLALDRFGVTKFFHSRPSKS